MKIFVKIDFKETQVYHFNGVVNNQRVDDNPTVSENIKLLNENQKIEIYPVEEKINGFPKLKSNMEYPYNTFHLSFKFPNWSVFTGFQHIINPNEFSIKLEKRKIIISGKIVLGLSVKDNCFEDLKSNINKCYVETVVVKKEINETTPHLNYNFSSQIQNSKEYKLFLPDDFLSYGKNWSKSINASFKKYEKQENLT